MKTQDKTDDKREKKAKELAPKDLEQAEGGAVEPTSSLRRRFRRRWGAVSPTNE